MHGNTPPPYELDPHPGIAIGNAFPMFRHNPTNLISLPMFWAQSVNEYGMNVLSIRMYGGIPVTQQ